ncbi:hypothetical protein ASE69_17080 [Sphingomonas sp. Leaf208]|uniref:hypothetical protein n=1 Tax=Sphingomonas sp. Leaf208 TaxID=1735679 RepID=UPI0006FE7F5B|nr:hypothetical protein [Sphingomonas sp. Leaf208]KQM46016.1 hypothetical protein ASE69_17080 [Sphingomonas sp. Leaf208]
MAKQSILALGISLPSCEGFEPIDFTDKRSLLDADIVVAEPNWSGFSNSYSDAYQGRQTLDEESSGTYREMRPHWARQYKEALDAGKALIFFLSDHNERNYYTGTYEASGTGRNARKTVHVNRCSNYDFIPIATSRLGFGSGKNMKLTQDGKILHEFWSKHGEHMTYHAYMSGMEGDVLVSTAAGNRTLGLLHRHPTSGGYMLFLPELDWSYLGKEVADDGEHWATSYTQFVRAFRKDLIDLDRAINSTGGREAAPEWVQATEFSLLSEAPLLQELDAVAAEAEKLSLRRQAAVAALDDESAWKTLLFGSGKELEKAVRGALILLGYEVSTVDDGTSEFDVVFEADGKRFIGEVEGKDTKPVSIDKASQLHRNLAEDFSREDIDAMAVGVLFGNGERLIRPNERSDTFTLKVRTFAATSNLTLLDTVELFKAVQILKAGAGDAYAASCRTAIAEAGGSEVKLPTS